MAWKFRSAGVCGYRLGDDGLGVLQAAGRPGSHGGGQTTTSRRVEFIAVLAGAAKPLAWVHIVS